MRPCAADDADFAPTWRRAGRPWCARWSCSAARGRRPRTSRRPGWRGATATGTRVRRADDVDAYVYAHRARRPGRPSRAGSPAPAEPRRRPRTPPTTSCCGRRSRSSSTGWTPTSARRVVLRFVADLSEAQVADVLDVPVESAQARITHGLGRIDLAGCGRRPDEPDERWPRSSGGRASRSRCRAARSTRSSPRPAPSGVAGSPYASPAVVGRGRRRGRRADLARRTGSRPPDDLRARGVDAGAPTRCRWRGTPTAGCTSRRSSVAVPAAAPTWSSSTAARSTATSEGTVAFVAADGQRRRIGRKDPDSPLVASGDEGWVAWVDPGGRRAARPTLVVYDVSAGELARRPTSWRRRRTPDRDRPAPGLLRDAGRHLRLDAGRGAAGAAGARRLLDVESGEPGLPARRADRDGAVVLQRLLRPAGHRRAALAGRRPRAEQGARARRRRGPAVPAAALRRPLRRPAAEPASAPTSAPSTRRSAANNTVVYLVAQVADLEGGSTSTATSTRCWCCAAAT